MRPDQPTPAASAVAVFAATFAIRFATLPEMRGDDHWPLWTAATFLKGDRPFRDFADLGDPLYWGLSALAQWAVGYRVIGEVLLGSALTAAAFTLAFLLAYRATSSLVAAGGLTLLGSLITAEAELYSYPKLFLYPLVAWLCWRYIDRPSRWRSAGLALGVAIAFLYRHDHGAYAGAGAAAAVLAAHVTAGPRRVLIEWLRLGGALVVLLLPFFVMVQRDEGVVSYFRERIRMATQMEASSRRPVPFHVDASAPADWLRVLPPYPARVFVTWKPEVTGDRRAALERKYSLTGGRNTNAGQRGTDWEYALVDTRTANIRAIVEDPAAGDTGLIDRTRFRPAEESWIIDAQRAVPLFRLSIAPRYWHADNAAAALHYLSRAVPFALLLLLVVSWSRGYAGAFMPEASAKTFTTAVLAAVAFTALVRRVGYFMDHTALATIAGACLVGHALHAHRQRAPWPVRLLSGATAAVFVLVWVCGALTYARSTTSLKVMNDNWRGLWWRRSVLQFQAYSVAPPIDTYAPHDRVGGTSLIRYVYECTTPDDRVWVMTDMFNFPYYTERRIVGHLYWDAGFLSSPEHQRRTLAMVERDPVPIIISSGRTDPMEHFKQYPLVYDYVARRYTRRYVIQAARTGLPDFYVLADNRRTPSGTYGDFGLPCFR
ncbi:MAG: hypothetical protein HY824_07065 [Acidobacteria bacterium]|nr:hypothetical protein [Acidobacteriota bacterium]